MTIDDTAAVDNPAPEPRQSGSAGSPIRRVTDWLTSPVPASLVAAFLIGAVFIVISGASPLAAYQSMLRGSLTGSGLVNTFERAIPIVAIALALVIAFRAGIFNLGGEGQMVLGGLSGTLVAIYLPGPGPLVIVAALSAAALAGALWAALSAVLDTALGVPILISSLLLNYPARYFSSYLVRFPLKDPSSSQVATSQVRDAARLPALVGADTPVGRQLESALGSDHLVVRLTSEVNWSLIAVVTILVAIVFVNRRTPVGFEAGLTGLNPRFARYGGVPLGRLKVQTMMVSGAISGLVGVMLILGSQYRLADGALVSTGYAWTGLLVALLAANKPVGAAIAGFFFGALIVGGEAMQRSEGISGQIAQIIQAAAIILITIRFGFTRRPRTPEVRTQDTDDVGKV